MQKNITIVGAGIIGMVCANYLQRDGHKVTVIDSRGPGEGCTAGNAALLSPDAVIPPAMPGNWRKIPGWILDPLGPLAIRWNYVPRITPWLAGWLRACSADRARAVARGLRALHAPVFDAYAPLLKDAGATHLLQRSGQLYVSELNGGASGSPLTTEMREAAGVHTQLLSGAAARELEPALGENIKSALYFPNNGHTINSLRLVQMLAEHFQRSGGTVLRRNVTGFETGEHGPCSVITDGGARPVETLLIAAGAWSGRLAAQLGTSLPLEAERGYHLTLPDPGVMPRLPLIHRDFYFTTTPVQAGLRMAGTTEFAGLDAPPDYRRARMLFTHAQRMLPGLRDSGATQWMGARPSFPDGLPVIDRSPLHVDVFFAFGHSHFGLTAAPVTGRLIADLVSGRKPSIDITPYQARRFS